MFRVIGQNILNYFYMYAEQGILIFICAFLIVFLIGGFYEKKHKKRSFISRFVLGRAAIAGILAAYVYVVIGITLLSRTESYSSSVNLQLFSTFQNTFWDRMFVYENILLFLPLGVLLFILAKPFRNVFVSMFTGIVCSFFIEMMQFVFHLGRFEVDDILTNTIGMLVGYLVGRIAAGVYQKFH